MTGTLSPTRLAPGPILPEIRDPRIARRRRRVAILGGAAASLLLVALFHRTALTGFAGLFRVDDPAPSAAIVLLLGGSHHRPQRAAELYRAGVAPVVLLGTMTDDTLAVYDETKIDVALLERHGVPRSAIVVLPGKVTSTREEAARVADYARTHPMTRITVVTTAFHTSRARWIFRRVLAVRGIDVRMAAAEHPDFDEASWFRTDEGLLTYLNEAFKVVWYRLRY